MPVCVRILYIQGETSENGQRCVLVGKSIEVKTVGDQIFLIIANDWGTCR